MIDRSSPVYVAGHAGLVGSAIWRRLVAAGFEKLIGRTSAQLDLRCRQDVFEFFASTRPRYVILAAARVGGIRANAIHPHQFLSDNVQIQVNVMDAALAHSTERLLFFGSSCIYPRDAPQPILENSLLTGPLEPTNDAFAVAKISGIHHVQAIRRQYGLPWITAMPTSLYGPYDNFSPTNSHLVPALIRRYNDAFLSTAPVVTNWGTGSPRRELLHVDDLADASLHLLDYYDQSSPINIGTGQDTSIANIAELVASAVGYVGETQWDSAQPDGTPRKLLDSTRLHELGWKPRTRLHEGITATVEWYRNFHEQARR